MFYLSAMGREYPFVVVDCPACGRPHEISKEAWLDKDWVLQCEGCGGTFGVVTDEQARRIVSSTWSKKQNPEPTYVDLFIIRRGYITQGRGPEVAFRRWHGWVDRETREIVQEG